MRCEVRQKHPKRLYTSVSKMKNGLMRWIIFFSEVKSTLPLSFFKHTLFIHTFIFLLLSQLFEELQSKLRTADDWGVGGKRRRAMQGYCQRFWEIGISVLLVKTFSAMYWRRISLRGRWTGAYKASFTVIITELTAVKTIMYIYILQIEK